ncbi:hypothetical protein FRC08_005060 [Ceratobasidium sp. 394]|nr:hypothetical protein FRC08_005060 [Ceratobasidium sp. 394]
MENLDPAVTVAFQALGAFQPSNERSRFLDLMAECPGPFTELKVLELADKANLLPISTCMESSRSQPPVFTLQPGDVGTYAKDYRSRDFTWFPTDSHTANDQNPTGLQRLLVWRCNQQRNLRSHLPNVIIGADGWHTYELHHDFEATFYKSESPSKKPMGWKSLVHHWARRGNKIQLGSLGLCGDTLRHRLTLLGLLNSFL